MSDVTIDFSGAEAVFGQALREMARLTHLPLKQVIKAEAASILKYCAGATKEAHVKTVSARARSRLVAALNLSDGDVTINSGMRKPETAGRIWAVSHGPRANDRKYRMAYAAGTPVGTPNNIHWAHKDWIDIEEAKFDYVRKVKQVVDAAVRAIGLSRQSWIQIADSLGIRLENVPGGRISGSAIRKARNAIASNGQAYQNGTSREAEATEQYFVDLVNQLPGGTRIGLPRILYVAIRNREIHFERLVEKGVFDSMQDVARQFPGFYVNQGNN